MELIFISIYYFRQWWFFKNEKFPSSSQQQKMLWLLHVRFPSNAPRSIL